LSHHDLSIVVVVEEGNVGIFISVKTVVISDKQN
jgi:hypothetical protein